MGSHLRSLISLSSNCERASDCLKDMCRPKSEWAIGWQLTLMTLNEMSDEYSNEMRLRSPIQMQHWNGGPSLVQAENSPVTVSTSRSRWKPERERPTYTYGQSLSLPVATVSRSSSLWFLAWQSEKAYSRTSRLQENISRHSTTTSSSNPLSTTPKPPTVCGDLLPATRSRFWLLT